MGNIFVSQPGSVAVIPGQGTLPGALSIVDSSAANIITTNRVVITGVGYAQRAHVQFQQTLLNAIYLYSFGDKMGSVEVSGICFSNICNANSSGSGVEDLLTLYNNNRVSKNNKYITVSIGSTQVIRGYLVGSDVKSLSAEFMTYQFTLNIAALPANLDGG